MMSLEEREQCQSRRRERQGLQQGFTSTQGLLQSVYLALGDLGQKGRQISEADENTDAILTQLDQGGPSVETAAAVYDTYLTQLAGLNRSWTSGSLPAARRETFRWVE
jgi:hypothetical protein